MSETVSAGEAARRLGVAAATIQRWVDKGLLHAERTPGGHRRIHVAELRRLIAATPAAMVTTAMMAKLKFIVTRRTDKFVFPVSDGPSNLDRAGYKGR